jgi:hypothetical protein
MRRVLLRAHDADAEASDAVEQALDAALVELLRLDAVVFYLAVGAVALPRLRASAKEVAHEEERIDASVTAGSSALRENCGDRLKGWLRASTRTSTPCWRRRSMNSVTNSEKGELQVGRLDVHHEIMHAFAVHERVDRVRSRVEQR